MPVIDASATAEMELLQTALDAAGVGVWAYDAGAETARADRRTAEMFGLPEDSRDAAPLHSFLEKIHQDDAEAVANNIIPGQPFDISYRIKRDGPDRWVRSIGRWGERDGANLLLGVTIDITEERGRQERFELLAQEMRHRVGNTFAILSGLVSLESDETGDATDLADRLRTRLADLSRAQSLTMRDGDIQPLQSLSDLIGAVAKPFLSQSAGRFDYQGPDVTLDQEACAILSLIFYEWLTNALKYGAFSKPSGTIAVRWRVDEIGLALVWDETLPDANLAAPKVGFGETMQQTALDPIGGVVLREWRETGVLLTLRLPLTEPA